MALNTLNTDAIAFKKLVGKAHTQQGFSFSEESIGSNVSLSFATVYGASINPIPLTSGLTALYATDGVVERVRFELEIIPDTLIGTNQSQGYRMKLPAGYTGSGALGYKFTGGTKLHTALGKLQIVPPLFGSVKPDGSTEYDPILYQTDGISVITKFDPIDWIIDYYNGVLFVQDPPAGYDVSALRPGFVDAFLYVGSYLDETILSGSTDWANITNKPTEFNPAPHVHPISGVTGLQGELDNRINIAEKGVASGVAPLDSNALVPLIHIPAIFKEVFVVADIAERTAKFVPSGTTGFSPTQVESFQGLRVYVLDCTGAPELPTGTTGACESIDTTGFLNWSAITSSQSIILDWTNVQGKPPLVNSITGNAGINVLPLGGTGNTTISTKVDDIYIETTVPDGELTIIEQSIDTTRLKYQNGLTGNTGQYIVRGTGDTFLAVNPPFGTVSGITALSGVTNIGTLTNPILIAQVNIFDNTIIANGAGLRVNEFSLGSNKLKFGSYTPDDEINGYTIPINTGSSYNLATDVGTAIEQIADRVTDIETIYLTGATNIGSGNGDLVASLTGNSIQFKNIKAGQYVSLVDDGFDITVSVTGISATTGGTGVIGPAEDGSYTDGLFVDFISTTPIGVAVDRFNEVLKALAPTPAPDMSNMSGSGTFVAGKLSFGSSKVIAGFTNVGTNAGNAAVDINGNYAISGTRLGITNTTVNGILNDSTVGGGGFGSIPFADNAFSDGDKGQLRMYKNGVLISTLILSGTTAATSNSRMSVSAVGQVKFDNGQPLAVFTYRTGTFNVPVSAMTNGYNYVRIVHSGATFSRQTNFLEWVYDNDATNITIGGATGLTNLTMSGTKYLSGINYHTGGTVQYQGTFSNAYKNVYSNSATAIDFVSKENLGAITNLNIIGTGIINRTGSTLQTLPDLDTTQTDPQNTSIIVLGTMPINASTLFGNVGVTGRIRSSVAIANPFTAQSYAGSQSTITGFLLNNTTQGTNLNNETFNGETDRLQARDYSVLTYANVNGGSYPWDSTKNILSSDVQHQTGMLVFNGELMYPNAAYLTTTYGITTGNFSAVANGPVGNPNYSTASGTRDYYRKFKSANGSTQSTLTFTIQHSGTNTDFLTNGGTGGVPAGNNLKFEFLIMRVGGAIHGWANPFASSGNPEGIANTSSSHGGGITTVTCTLATTPRVAINDIVVVRIFTASGYTNRILNLAITNI